MSYSIQIGLEADFPSRSEEALSGPEFTNQYFIYYVRKLPVWVKW